jgi:hypothetical protein
LRKSRLHSTGQPSIKTNPQGNTEMRMTGPRCGVDNPAYRHGEVHRVNGKRITSTEYRSWQQMKNRCLNPRSRNWSYYGGRGITIDPRWHQFETFLADMGRKPAPDYTLERKDNNMGYSKGNCIWATRQTQARNRPDYNKLDQAAVDQIRLDYATGNYLQRELADRYNCSQMLISQVIRKTTWR